jgi:hypothetical protein
MVEVAEEFGRQLMFELVTSKSELLVIMCDHYRVSIHSPSTRREVWRINH